MIYVFLADGFEEVEAFTPVDFLRRAGLAVATVGVGKDMPIGSHGICVKADCREEDIDFDKMEAVILPGGMPGMTNLDASPSVQATLKEAFARNVVVGAICAAPSVLGWGGYLMGKKATAYPGFEKNLLGADVSAQSVVVDGNVVTAKGAGVSADFALELVSLLKDKETADEIRRGIQCR